MPVGIGYARIKEISWTVLVGEVSNNVRTRRLSVYGEFW
jgi:hypothetical protein